MALTAHKLRATATPTYLSDLYTPVRQHGHYGHLTLRKWSSFEPTPIWQWHDAPSVSRLHLHVSGTLCLLNFDCATAQLHSNLDLNDTQRHICLQSTSHPSPPPAPLRLRISRRPTNSIIIGKLESLGYCVTLFA